MWKAFKLPKRQIRDGRTLFGNAAGIFVQLTVNKESFIFLDLFIYISTNYIIFSFPLGGTFFEDARRKGRRGRLFPRLIV